MSKHYYMVRKSAYRLVTDYFIVTACNPDEAVTVAVDTGAKMAHETQQLDLNTEYKTIQLAPNQVSKFFETSIKPYEFFE